MHVRPIISGKLQQQQHSPFYQNELAQYREGPNNAAVRRPPACDWLVSDEGVPLDENHPYQSLQIRCCDLDLEESLRKSIEMGINSEKLGDAVKYDPFDIPREDWFTALDAQEHLGSTRPLGVRGYFPDIAEDPLAGEDLSCQPPIRQIETYDNQFKYDDQRYKNQTGRSSLRRKRSERTVNRKHHQVEQNSVESEMETPSFIIDKSDEEDETLIENKSQTQNVNVTDGIAGPPPKPKYFENSRWNEKLPKGTHCIIKQTTGNKCCDGVLSKAIRDAVTELSTSPMYGPGSEGIIAGVIVSRGDFVFVTHHVGTVICKQFYKEFTILAYSTPRQYDIDYQLAENYFFSISVREPLGSTDIVLPNMKSFHVPLALEHVGSYCCNLALYNALICAYNELIDQPNFYQYNLRQIAKKLQWDAEEIVQHSMEVIVSYDDFVFRANHQNDRVCKFRVDKYHIFAYETEVKYPLHWPVNVDLGEAKSINCPSKLKELNGQACCNPELQYEIFSTIDEQKQLPGFNKHDTQKMATMLLRRVQRKFNTTFESIISPAEFVWGTQRYNERICKIDAGLFSALTFQSSPLPPPSSDFVDLPQSNGGGGTQGQSSGSAGQSAANRATINQNGGNGAQGQNSGPTDQSAANRATINQNGGDGTQGQNSGLTDQSVANRATINQLSNQLAQTQRALEIAQSQSQQNAAIAEQSAAQARAGGAQAFSYYNSLYQEYQNSNWLRKYCFSDDTWLTTPNGKKRMSEINVGDFVLTANKTHVINFVNSNS
ncbi:hypothetical protein WR25_16175 [Diploscapter pachys]|uniref:Ground-like domain-containing protein n=1 Tax=Diploscapter pachys TaxID=2018661 RepID=A0A2A2KTS5_9BILA|nr:hypothetical protein WR25_16175 [Diploscapter pachys]